MKIDLQNKKVTAVIDQQSEKYPRVVIVVEESPGDKYGPELLAFEFSKNLDERAKVRVGNVVDIAGYLGSREGKGRYFTSVRGTYCKVNGETRSEPARGRAAPAPSQGDDDIPF